jgi:thiamine pyrophosphate-dependent acetolactate synthase large subunit-like protein
MDERKSKEAVAPVAARLFGSDVVADALREQDIPYICINPGASYRGLHDSLVNYLGNNRPRMLLCLHEEHAVAICHGYAAATDRPLAAIVHSTVGLMHASMAIFNAWCARAPVLVIGATGPIDATKRRPWIDWIHTAADQGALVRDYTKWDDQPGSAAAAVESIRRATTIAVTRPSGPVYVNLDSAIQEGELDAPPALHPLDRYARPQETEPALADVEWLAERCNRANRPLILSGRMLRDEGAWADRLRLAEAMQARVITDSKDPTSFPTTHPLHLGECRPRLASAFKEALQTADLVLALDWVDLGGTLAQAFGPGQPAPCIVTVSNDFHVHRGWSMDYQALPTADRHLATTPEATTRALLRHISARPEAAAPAVAHGPEPARAQGPIGVADLAHAFAAASASRSVSLTSRPIGWPPDANVFEHPLDYLGRAAGGGLGAGPGMIVGAALALRDMESDRIPVAILGDGDYLMGVNALWTAAAERIPLLIVVANNGSYYNDEEHQKQVARMRGRPVENAPIGQRLDTPAPDLVGLARAQGLDGEGPVDDLSELPAALTRAFDAVRRGGSFVLDVRVKPEYENRSLQRR